jgi:DNA-binding LacI/PurR family transcriptional regulator
MSITNKQVAIVKELEQRIATGFYGEKLPKGLDLAAEFEVNFKTLNKAINQLVEKGLLYRKPGLGTFIAKEKTKLEDTLIELLFVGSSEMSVHPFYSEMWRGALDAMNSSGYKLVLSMLEEDPRHGGLKNICRDFTPSAGKILIGTSNEEQVKRLKKEKVPFVLAGSKSADPEVVSVYTDTSEAIISAVDYLRKQQLNDIAYIGITHSDGEHSLDLEKFHAYLAAVQKNGKFDSDLIENTPPLSLAKFSYDAMQNILKRKPPQAVIVAYDHLAPGVYQAINDAGLSIPGDISVIGIDGTNPNVIPELTSIKVDRHAMGFQAGKLLLNMIRDPRKNKYASTAFNAVFDPHAGTSIS